MTERHSKEGVGEMYVYILMAVSEKFPFPVVERAHLTVFQPTRYAVEVKSVIARAPCDRAIFGGDHQLLFRLTFDAQVHDVITADGTVVHDNVPRPQRDSVPLLHLEVFLGLLATAAGRRHCFVDLHLFV